MSQNEKFRYLMEQRGGKCMIRSDLPVYQIALEYQEQGRLAKSFLMPWSPAAAALVGVDEKWIKRLESYDYSHP